MKKGVVKKGRSPSLVQKNPAADDFSNRTVVIMLLLVIVVSVLSILLYQRALTTAQSMLVPQKPMAQAGGESSAGQISLTIVDTSTLPKGEGTNS